MSKWNVANLGKGDPKEAKVAASTNNRVLRFEPGNDQLLGIVTKESFPLAGNLTISLFVARRDESPDSGQAVIFLEKFQGSRQPDPA